MEQFTDRRSQYGLSIEPSIAEKIPTMVKSELVKMLPEKQMEFVEEFSRKSARTFASYLCSLFFCHYGYLGKWGITVMMWFVSVVTFGVGALVWWVIDLFRIPGMVERYNRDIAVQVLRDMKIIHGS